MRKCLHCNNEVVGRPDKKFCSTRCYQRHWYDRPSFPYERKCKVCKRPFMVSDRSDANRKYCSQNCSRKAYAKGIKVWHELHPGKMREYRNRSEKKNVVRWREKGRKERAEILQLLGGSCIVCRVSNSVWLHVDYIPTTRTERFRHSRTLKFVSAHRDLFRILCANHHYELTLTGQIAGTDIVQ